MSVGSFLWGLSIMVVVHFHEVETSHWERYLRCLRDEIYYMCSAWPSGLAMKGLSWVLALSIQR